MHMQHVFAGSKKAMPIVLGYLPLGFAYGALASLAGISLPVIVMKIGRASCRERVYI